MNVQLYVEHLYFISSNGMTSVVGTLRARATENRTQTSETMYSIIENVDVSMSDILTFDLDRYMNRNWKENSVCAEI